MSPTGFAGVNVLDNLSSSSVAWFAEIFAECSWLCSSTRLRVSSKRLEETKMDWRRLF